MTDTASKALIEMHADAVRNLAEANERIAQLTGVLRSIRERTCLKLPSTGMTIRIIRQKCDEALGDSNG